MPRPCVEPGLWPTLADASHLLTERGIPFALIGGLAVSLRGQPRLTVDVDLVVLGGGKSLLALAGAATRSSSVRRPPSPPLPDGRGVA